MTSPIDDYLAGVPEAHRVALQKLRVQISKMIPEAHEVIYYGMPAFELEGPLVGFASFKNHVSFFPMSGTLVADFADELTDFKTSKGAIQFTPDKPIPQGLLKRMVLMRAGQNVAKSKGRAPKSMTVSELHKSGAVSGRGRIQAGRKHGKWEHFYATGVLQSHGAYRYGELHGKWEWFRADGTLMRTGEFKDGVQVGAWSTYDRAGKLVKTTVMKPVVKPKSSKK